jgi:hypothetical protein
MLPALNLAATTLMPSITFTWMTKWWVGNCCYRYLGALRRTCQCPAEAPATVGSIDGLTKIPTSTQIREYARFSPVPCTYCRHQEKSFFMQGCRTNRITIQETSKICEFWWVKV